MGSGAEYSGEYDGPITKEEVEAIEALEAVAEIWPKTLYLFSASGSLWVMKLQPDGTPKMLPDGGADQDQVITGINIENDGGDW